MAKSPANHREDRGDSANKVSRDSHGGNNPDNKQEVLHLPFHSPAFAGLFIWNNP
jgi:hypothetical protein